MAKFETIEKKIEQTKLKYTEVEKGVRLEGAAFVCEFETPVDPETFCETIRTIEEPWRIFGVKTPISDEYWKLVGNLFHVDDDGDLTGSTHLSLEVSREWVRIYVRDSGSSSRVAAFVRAIDAEYGLEAVEFGNQDSER